MTVVSDTLISRLKDQINKHKTVVWYDPDQDYELFIDSLKTDDIDGAPIYRYSEDQGFIWLRYELESIWSGTINPPKVLIYVPIPRPKSQYALIEYEAGGVVLEPGKQPPERNTDLAFVTQKALEPIFPEAKIEELLEEIREGKLTLEELNEIGEKGSESGAGALGVIFKTGNPREIALRFLTNSEFDNEIQKREALQGLINKLDNLLNVSFSGINGTNGLRKELARTVLVTDFIESIDSDPLEKLQTVKAAEKPLARQVAVELANMWRNRRDYAESYVFWSDKIGSELDISSIDVPLAELLYTNTFLAVENVIQERVEEKLVEKADKSFIADIEHRRAGFWSLQNPEIKARWNVIVNAGKLILLSSQILNSLKKNNQNAESLFKQYTMIDQEDPWCKLDTVQRYLERDFHQYEIDPTSFDRLIKLVTIARNKYSETANRLSVRFVRAFEDSGFEISHVTTQSSIFRNYVEPQIEGGKTAYILVDAFRYELALEIVEIIGDYWSVEIDACLATPPTITTVGMASSLPGAENGINLVEKNGELSVELAENRGALISSRSDRVSYLEKSIDGKFVETKINSLSPLSDKKLRDSISKADFIFVTGTENIDGLGENNPSLARRIIDDSVNQLRRAIKSLVDMGVGSIVISADHGYLFGQKISPGQGIESPGGKPVTLKRRVWVGTGGARSENYLRAPLSSFGIGGEFDLATPWNISCFKVPGGSMEYFHGGLSLPEMAVPVVLVRAEAESDEGVGSRIDWEIEPGSETISTRFYSVTVKGLAQELLPIEPPLVRVELRIEDHPISVPVSASYGFSEKTKDVQLETEEGVAHVIMDNTVTLMITEDVEEDYASLYLIDADSGLTLYSKKDIPLQISL